MPVDTYETLFLLDPTKVSADAEAIEAADPPHPGAARRHDRGQPPVGLQPQADVPDRQAEEGRVPHHLLHDGEHQAGANSSATSPCTKG